MENKRPGDLLRQAKRISVISMCLIWAATSLSCRNLLEKLNEVAFPRQRTLVSEKKKIELTIPKGWREDKSLNEQADIQASNRLQENYIIVISENKSDFDEMNALKHSGLTSSAILANLEKGEINQPKKMKINGRKAYQYVIQGVAEHIKLTYLHTTIDGADYYHQIIAWTLRSRFKENEATLQQVTNSLRETGRKSTDE